MYKFFLLLDLLPRLLWWRKAKPAALQWWLPKTNSHVQGFSVRVKRNRVCLLTKEYLELYDGPSFCIGEGIDFLLKKPDVDLCVDEYFEVSVEYDGSNPLYPDLKKFNKVSLLLTNLLFKEVISCSIGSIFTKPLGARFCRIIIQEEYHNGRYEDLAELVALRPPSYNVCLKVDVMEDGAMAGGYALGVARRPAKR